MSKIVFFSTPAYGHVISSIPVLDMLGSIGYEVDYYGLEQFKDTIQKARVNFINYSVDFDITLLNVVTANFLNLYEKLTEINQKAFLEYENVFKSFSKDTIIIYDSMCSFAKNLAIKYELKHVCLVTTLAFNLPVFLFSNMFTSSISLFGKNLPA